MKQNNRRVGSRFEDLASAYLQERGYYVIARNYRNRFGEIDIIAKAPDDTLVFAEVKYRSTDAMAALEAVTPAKRRQISRIALFYLNQMKAGIDLPCRFDVIGIDGLDRITHVENAFDFVQ
ncbi:MAG: YraN family protein [Lachnospiraceae bacterium]|nr:YraN family protein [Lachnospiraceae bacterium]